MSKSFQKIIRDVTVQEQTHGDVDISSVEYDSRRVGKGSLFVAMRGESTDGNRYIATSIERGATAVITDSRSAFDETRTAYPVLPIALVERGRRALAEASAAFFDHPEKALKLCGVTGTNGKTTTAFLIEGLLRSVGRETVLIGTIETHVGSEVRPSPHTTPESRDVLEIFADGVRVGAPEAVMEMSSHALEQAKIQRRIPQSRWASWFPDRGVKELLSLLELADRSAWIDGAYRAKVLDRLNSVGHYRLVLNYWNQQRG